MDKTGIILIAIAVIVFFLPVAPLVKLLLGLGALLIGASLLIRAIKERKE